MAVRPTGYERERGTSSVPALPGRSAESFGAGVGQAMASLGGQLHQDGLRAREMELRRQSEADAAAAGVAFAKMSTAAETAVNGLRETAGPGGAGHVAAVEGELDRQIGAFMEGLGPNERVRARYQELSQEWRGRLVSGEDGWARVRRAERQVADIGETVRLFSNEQMTRPNEATLPVQIEAISASIRAGGLSADLAERVEREQLAGFVGAYLQGKIEQNPGAAQRILQAGALNRYLTPEQIARLTDATDSEVRVREADARRVAAQGEAEDRDRLQLFNARLAQGDVPTEAEFDQISTIARGHGWGAEVFNNEAARARVTLNRETRNWGPREFDAAINALEALGDRRSVDQNVRLTDLRQLRGARVAEYNNDPQGHAARGGAPAPILDPDPTPQQVQARATWAEAYARTNGVPVPPYLSAAEIAPLRQLNATGPGGRLQVAAQLRQQWGAARGRAIAQLIAPHDAHLRLAVMLPPETGQLYQQGLGALQRNNQLFDQARAREIFAEVQEAIPPQYREAAWDAARAIVAGNLDVSNRTGFDEDSYRMALHLALGARGQGEGRRGGLGWNPRGTGYIWLPDNMGQGDFERRVSRADADQWRAAGGGRGAFFAGSNGRPGRAVTVGELRAAEYETVTPGVYRVKGPVGGYLVDSQGRPWQFDVRRLP